MYLFHLSILFITSAMNVWYDPSICRFKNSFHSCYLYKLFRFSGVCLRSGFCICSCKHVYSYLCCVPKERPVCFCLQTIFHSFPRMSVHSFSSHTFPCLVAFCSVICKLHVTGALKFGIVARQKKSRQAL